MSQRRWLTGRSSAARPARERARRANRCHSAVGSQGGRAQRGRPVSERSERTDVTARRGRPMSEPGGGDLDPDADPAHWRRLDARVLAVFPLRQAGALIPLLAVLLITGQGAGRWQLVGALGAPALLVFLGAARWLTVRYRVGADRVVLRTGLLHRQERSLRRDRVRTVDLHARPVHRLFGLTVVEVGTGSTTVSGEGKLSLDAVTTREGE